MLCLPFQGNDCAIGKYRSGSSETALICNDCPVGWNSNALGQSTCLPCVPGKYQLQEGKTTCSDCPTGWFADESKSKVCSLCPIGQKTEVTGSASCQKFANTYNVGMQVLGSTKKILHAPTARVSISSLGVMGEDWI